MAPFLRDRDHLSLAQTGFLISSSLVGSLVSLILWGLATDRIGERLVLVVGLSLCGAALIAAGQAHGFWALGGRLTWISALVLTIAPFTDWYAGPDTTGPTLAVIGWHTGVLGKLVFFIGLALLALVVLSELGYELPPTVPESLVVIALGSVATIFVLIRLISIPDSIPPPAGRGIGIWISLLASLGVIVAGLLRASEEL